MTDIHHLPPLPPTVRALTNAQADALDEKHPTSPRKSVVNCVTCRGAKTFRWWSYASIEGGNEKHVHPVDFKCPCGDQYLLHRWLLNSNLQINFQQLSWRDAWGIETGAMDVAQDYLDHYVDYCRQGRGLILHGPNGNGKTMLATLILKSLILNGFDCYSILFSEMITEYMAGWKSEEYRHLFDQRIRSAGVLHLDEMGKEYQGLQRAGLPESTFEAVLRYRIGALLPTIITTNRDPVDWGQRYGASTMSLLGERAVVYQMKGLNWRPKLDGRLEQERDLGLVRPVVLG